MDEMEHDTAALQELSAMLIGDAVPSSLGDREDPSEASQEHGPSDAIPMTLDHSDLAGELNDESDDNTAVSTATSMTDSSYATTAEASITADPKKRYRQGRQKKAAELIDNHNRLHVAFCKRKDGAMKKATELDVMTGCAIILVIQPAHNNSAPVSTYAYSSNAWRSVFFGEGMRTMLNEPHTARTSRLYQPTDKYPENVLEGDEYHQVSTQIVDKLSDSRDSSCAIVHTSMKRCKTEEPAKKLQQRQEATLLAGAADEMMQQYEDELQRILVSVADGGEEEDEDPEAMGYFDAQISGASSHPEPPTRVKEQHRKRSYTPETLIPNLVTRSLCYSKRRLGLFKKIFELVALTDCRAVIASAWMPSSGEEPLKYHIYASPEWRNSAGYTRFVRSLVAAQRLERVHREPSTPPHVTQVTLGNFLELLGHGGKEFETSMTRAHTVDDYLLPANAISVETPSMAQQKRLKKTAVVTAANKKGSKIKQTTWIKFLWVFPPKGIHGDGSPIGELPVHKKVQQQQRRGQKASERFRKEMAVFAAEVSESEAIPDTGVQHVECIAVTPEEAPICVVPAQDLVPQLKRRRSIERTESEDPDLLVSPKESRVQPSLSESELKAACDAIDLLIRLNEHAATMTRASLVVSTPPPLPVPAVTKAPPVPRLASPKTIRGVALSVSTDSVPSLHKMPINGVASSVRRVDATQRSSIVMLM